MEERNAPKRILTIAAGVALGMIAYQAAKLVWLIALEILWEASRLG